MKKSITILFICLLQSSFATTYYVASNGSDAANGTSTSTPWQSLSKVNATTFVAGDQILFRRGDTFFGNIVVKNSGNSSNPIFFGAYGTGAKPVIAGMQAVTSWTNLGSNIWESTGAVSTLPTLKVVTINGVTIPCGATPNRDAAYPFLPNYYPYQSHTGNGKGTTTVTSSSLDGTNWTGADIVVRANHWTMDKETITASSSKTLTYVGQAPGTDGNGIVDGWGFFIQNDARTLDVQNEWYYNPSTKKIRIYSTSMPTGVQVTNVDTVFYNRVHDYIQVDNIQFFGANTSAIVFSSSHYGKVTNCDISYNGEIAIQGNNTSNYFDVENNNLSDLGGAGIWNTDNGVNWIIKNNTIRRQGLVSVTMANDYTGGAIEIFSQGALVQYNRIDSTSYEGIHFRGKNVQVRNNYVSNFGFLRDDGGGIYTGFTGETGKIIDGNIVLNSVGNRRGIPGGAKASNGIYLDGLTDSATATNNTVANMVSAGIFINSGRNNTVRGNTVYNTGGQYWTKGALMSQTYKGARFASYQRGNKVVDNIFFQKYPAQVNVFYYQADNTNTIQQFGIIDSNYYAKAMDTTYMSNYNNAGHSYYYNLTQWRTATGQDGHSQFLSKLIADTSTIKLVINPSKTDSVINLGAKYQDIKGVLYKNSITLSPYRSAILIYDSPAEVAASSGGESIYFKKPLR